MTSHSDIFASFGPNSGYIEDLYQRYRVDRNLVGESWAAFFDHLAESSVASVVQTPDHNGSLEHDGSHEVVDGRGSAFEVIPDRGEKLPTRYSRPAAESEALQERIYRLVSAFRNRGHLKARINPLSQGVVPLPEVEDTELGYYNFTEEQLGKVYPCAGFKGREAMPLAELVVELDRVYAGSIGCEFGHLLTQEERLWLQDKIERRFEAGYRLTASQKLRRLQKIIDAEAFESSLHRKYVGHKRFSLQGAETIIPMLSTILEHGSEFGVREVVLGMSHRGRLNVLRNILGKPLTDVFSEFDDQNIFSALGSGDVKYHMGFDCTYMNPDGQMLDLTLAPNPSHLEFVGPVVLGMTRARQDMLHGRDRRSVLPVLIHGDAAFVGQGVVTETLNLANVDAHKVGGTIHLIINNQIGFTTSPNESRSSIYCTDFAKAVQALILHVNGEDVEAACWATKLALDFSNRYQRDVVLDLYCYRKYGHNEGDDPSFTQPVIYEEIHRKPPISELYGAQLIEQGVVSEAQIRQYFDAFQVEFESAHKDLEDVAPIGEACPMHGRLRVPTPETGVSREALERIASTLVNYPDTFVPHPKLVKILEKRVESLSSGSGIDWGFAEVLAFGSLVLENVSVRLTGQDSGRGTFSQRHMLLTDNETGSHYLPFSQLVNDQTGSFEVYNSTLSEAAVLGYEFGYASQVENSLVLWEAQFGDFANGAQVIIDQFISSSEQKWDQRSGVVLLLPHGYEGQGPEHSSARLERFLQLCADGNMVVCYPSNASQYFHLLRRQGLMSIKRPMVVMTPKSLLRSQAASCELGDLTAGQFHTVLEQDVTPDGRIDHVIFCTGKIYYDVMDGLAERGDVRARVIRIEQLYPFPQYELKRALRGIEPKTCIWAQEEPINMGAWFYIEPYLRTKIDLNVAYAGRPLSASTATGSSRRHVVEQRQIIKDIFSVWEQSED